MTLIIDGNNLFHRFCSVMGKGDLGFLNSHQNVTNLCYKVMHNIAGIVERLPEQPEHIIFVCDGKWNWRDRMGHIDYKGHRGVGGTDRSRLHIIMDAFGQHMRTNYGWGHVAIDGYEGDDLLCLFSSYLWEQGKSSIILSSDGDTRQLLRWDPKSGLYIAVFDGMGDKMCFYLPESMEAKGSTSEDFGGLFETDNTPNFIGDVFYICPERVSFIKTIGGDSGDNVPSVYIKMNSKNKPMSFGEGYATSMYTKYNIAERDELMKTLAENDAYRRLTASRILEHMKSKEISRIGEIADNISRNIKYIYLHRMVYDWEQIERANRAIISHIRDEKMIPLYQTYLANPKQARLTNI